MNVEQISAMANRLSIPQLQQAMRDGTLPPYVGMPILQQKVKLQQAAKNAQSAGQPQPPTVAEQVEGAAHQANMEDVMRQRAMVMQADMGQTGGISDFLPKHMAKGGVIAFAQGSVIPGMTLQQAYDIMDEPMATPVEKLQARHVIDQQSNSPAMRPVSMMQPKGVDIPTPAIQTIVPKQIQPVNIGSNQPTTPPPTTNIGSNQPDTTAGGVLALPSAPAMTGFNGSEYDKALSGKESEEDYRKRMEDYLGPNTGIESLRGKLSKLEEESVADKEKAPWMALMKAGLATMAGTSPYALTNIGKGAQEGVADYIDAQKEFRKAQEKQFEIQSQLESAQRRERSDIYKYGAESKRADQANDRTVELAKAGAENQYKLHQLDNEVQIRGQNISAGNAAASLAETKRYHDLIGGSGKNLSDYEGSRNLAMSNPDAPQFAKYFQKDASGKPVFDDMAFHKDWSAKQNLASMKPADLLKVIETYGEDSALGRNATQMLNQVMNVPASAPNVIRYDSKGNRI